MPVEPDREERIQRLLADHRAAAAAEGRVKRWQADERRLAFGRVENDARVWPWATQTRAYPTTGPLVRQEPRSGGDES